MLHITVDLGVLILGIVLGILGIRKNWPSYLAGLPFVMAIILAAELLGEIYHTQNNLIIFNLLSVIEFVYFSFFFSRVIPGTTLFKQRVFIAGWVLALLCLLNIFFIQGRLAFHTYTYVLGSLFMICIGVLHLYRFFRSGEKVTYLREPAFWMTAGIIFFYVAAISVVGVYNYLAVLPPAIIRNLKTLLLFVNTLFYTTFVIALLCRIIRRF